MARRRPQLINEKVVIPLETARKALMTFPVSNQLFTADFAVKLPLTGNYIDKCAENGVIPHSRCDFRYDLSRNTFVVKDIVCSPSGHLSDRAIIRGGKFSSISFRTGLEDGRLGYALFNREFSKEIFKNGYQPTSARWWLSAYHFSGYSEGTQMDEGVTLSMHKEGRELEIKVRLEGKGLGSDRERVLEWFTSLHGTKIA